MIDLLVTYDVSTETPEGRRRLRQIAKICEDYGQRVQYSVFECSVDEAGLHRMREKILNVIDFESDSLRIYRVSAAHPDAVEEHGKNRSQDFEGPLIV